VGKLGGQVLVATGNAFIGGGADQLGSHR
jgi:hypothetical protein